MIRRTATLTLASAVLGLALLGSTASAQSSAPTVEPSRYVRDVRVATAALGRYARLLQEADSLSALVESGDGLRAQGRLFTRATRRLGRYRLTDGRLNAQRSRLAARGPRLGAAMVAFVGAVETRSRERIVATRRVLRVRLGQFRAAARS